MGKRKTDQQYVVYTDELAQQILDRISNGEVLTKICEEEGMPSRSAVKKWRRSKPDFAAALKEARDDGFDAIADSCIPIADDGRNDYIEGPNGPQFNPENVQRSKLRIWTRLQLLKSWDPKRYGDMIRQEHSGSLSLEAIVSGSFKDGDGGR